MIKVVIIDDEASCREILETFIKKFFPEIEIAGMADSVTSGYECIKKCSPDLVFLDINLKDGTGFNLVEKFSTVDFKIIFVTAYNEYAIKAIKFNAIDYLLKPLNVSEFKEGVERAVKEIGQNGETVEGLDNPMEELERDKKIVLKTAESIYLVSIKNIIRCESESSYTFFYLLNGSKIMISKTLREFEEILNRYNFMRVHQSHLINLSFVDRFDKKEGGTVVMVDDTKIPVSYRRRQKLMDYFETF
ncbi:response regulator transcription factor [Puteibacter caeruleilacunae]|nr:response regulator transcription factor [Puteibacter caeruleilacunae]